MPEFEVEVTVEVTKRYRVNAEDGWEARGKAETEAEDDHYNPGVINTYALGSRLVPNGEE